MSNHKHNSAGVRNLELLRAYYSGDRTAGENTTLVSGHKNKLSVSMKAATAGLLALIFVVSICYAYYNKYIKPVNSVKILFPANEHNNIAYYTQKQLKDNNVIVLGGQNNIIAINFEKALDLSWGRLSFAAKGKSGNEKVAIILKDKYYMSNANINDIILSRPLFSDEWQAFRVEFENIKLPLNKNSIIQLRFDNSSSLTGSPDGAVVYIKNINIDSKNKPVKKEAGEERTL